MRKGIYIPEYETEPDDLVNQIIEVCKKNQGNELEILIAKLRVERHLRLHADVFKRLKGFGDEVMAREIHSQIATCGFGRPHFKDGKRIIKSFSHAKK